MHLSYAKAFLNPQAREHPESGVPKHIEHCFDYLRQAVFCAADTNLEPLDPKIMNGTETAIPRKCRDMRVVHEWAGKWKATFPSAEIAQRLGAIRINLEQVYGT